MPQVRYADFKTQICALIRAFHKRLLPRLSLSFNGCVVRARERVKLSLSFNGSRLRAKPR